MSKFSGPQHRGASRQLHAQRHAEAETRQAAERARYEQRRREAEREYANARPLTGAEFAELIRAARIALGACRACTEYGHSAEFCPLLLDDMDAVTG